VPYFSQIRWSFFRISPRYYLSQFSQVIALFHFSRKSQNRKFLEFFQLFAAFIEVEKCRLFSPFFIWPAIDSCQEKVRNLNQCSCSFNIIATFQCHLLLNLASCYIYLWSNLQVISASQGVKQKETEHSGPISNLFKQLCGSMKRIHPF